MTPVPENLTLKRKGEITVELVGNVQRQLICIRRYFTANKSGNLRINVVYINTADLPLL
jgi:hypothetical protein